MDLKRIGIIGGGQLGKMMILEAKKMGFYVTVLDPAVNAPASSICDELITAPFNDRKAFFELAEKSDVITYEFEHIDSSALLELEKTGKEVYPTARSLKIIQDKFTQKQALLEAGVPVPEFRAVRTVGDILVVGESFGYPLILKTCVGGYDGKGNAVIKKPHDAEEAYNALGGGQLPLMAERYVDFAKEISVLACRGVDGQTVVYPVGENSHINSILDKTSVPADIETFTEKQALSLAAEVMQIFQGVGMFCVEMFVTQDGGIFINEVAPRPHNSGHYSIEACVTSQFENHIRAVAGLPLGDTALIRPAVMRNLLGSVGSDGRAEVRGMSEALAVKAVKLHIYGKEFTKPLRKMGHLTATAETLAEAEALAQQAFDLIKVTEKNS